MKDRKKSCRVRCDATANMVLGDYSWEFRSSLAEAAAEQVIEYELTPRNAPPLQRLGGSSAGVVRGGRSPADRLNGRHFHKGRAGLIDKPGGLQ